ncbi:putative holin-like toxin [Melissococcus plutonius]
MSAFENFQLIIAFGTFTMALIKLVVDLCKLDHKK